MSREKYEQGKSGFAPQKEALGVVQFILYLTLSNIQLR